MSNIDTDFDFDCPGYFTDLNQENVQNNILWFSTVQPFHENSSTKTRSMIDVKSRKTVVSLVQFPKSVASSEESKAKAISSSSASIRDSDNSQTSNSPIKKKSRKSPASTVQQLDEKEMLLMLRRHNQKFAPTTKYEPPRHSVRDVRKWEKLSGREWSSLTPDERIHANEEILKMKRLE